MNLESMFMNIPEKFRESAKEAYFKAISKAPETEKQLILNRIEVYNRQHGELDKSLYNCSCCLNRGYIAFYNEITKQEEYKECTCLKVRRTLKEMQASGMYELLVKHTFDNFETPEIWQEKVMRIAKFYSETSKLETWFYIGGQSGAGKTHISTAICNKLFEKGLSGKYLIWNDVIREINSHTFDNSAFCEYMNSLLNVDFIYIDDFLKNHTEKENKNVFAFVDRLYKSKVKAIFSSEIFMNNISKYVDSAVMGRIVERCTETKGDEKGIYSLSINEDISRNYRLKEVIAV